MSETLESQTGELVARDEGGGVPVVFSFGDPEPVLKSRVPDYLGVFADSTFGYWIPPIFLEGLARSLDANAHHGPIVYFKRNMLARWFRPSPMLGYADFRKAALDWHTSGMAYFRVVRNVFGQVLRLERRPALYMRVGVEPGRFFELRTDPLYWRQPVEYQPGEIIQIKEDDPVQDIYGKPEWYGGLQSVFLREDMILFRRKYYRNGAHMGYVFVTHDAGINDETAAMIEEKIKDAKGPGNFRNLYINIGRSSASKEPVKVIPIGDIATKDDLMSISSITRSDALAMHRMQPGIAGVMPENMTGFGDLEKVMRVYCELEVPPMQQPFLILNDILPPAGRIGFDPPVWANAVAG
ncbi:phage portal protein [Methylomagnum ishizawai]|uniref:phage portal protein n=1 Tax=Methylomagnum ishizawai TaxID=1760988 RepID=UPI001C33824E|nr:phage portal protein [Methylomagnum ishizawai]BBL73982.1 portal protein [Methylomagnum ishizawai]